MISTFGRGLWILDDINPLREINPQIAAADAYLFAPATSMRVRWENYRSTPYPIETPAGRNPPDGAILDYYLKTPPAGEMTLTVCDDERCRGRALFQRGEAGQISSSRCSQLLVCS